MSAENPEKSLLKQRQTELQATETQMEKSGNKGLK